MQSLTLLHAPWMTKQADQFAQRVRREAGDDADTQARLAYRLALARDPESEELDAAAAFVRRQGLFHLCRVLLNCNEFLYID